jgi:purine-nucleoside phosphorylase
MSPFDTFAAAVREHQPRTAVVLGSGLGAVPHGFDEVAAVPFGEVPGLVAPSVHGHSGAVRVGRCGGQPLIVFRGRLHFYEGHPWDQVAAPVRAAAGWGVKVLLLTNAAGGIHDALGPGDLMVLRDHLWLQRPLTVGQVSNLSRFRDRLETCPTPPYSPRLVDLLQGIERDRGRPLMAGVYAAVTGPCYETPAEIRALRAMGADAVGMSTAWEARTAVECGMEVAAISCVTNKAAGLTCGTLDHREVLANAAKPAERLSEILESFVALASRAA